MQKDRPTVDVDYRLTERIKELTALRRAAALTADPSLSHDDLLERVVALLPPAFQYPERATAAIMHGDTVAVTPGYETTQSVLSVPFTTQDGSSGRVDVAYRNEPLSQGDPFLIEERQLLDAIAELLQSALNQRLTERRLRHLLRVSTMVTSELNLDRLLTTVSDLMVEDLGHTLATIVLWDEHERRLRRHALAAAEELPQIPDGDRALNLGSPSMQAFESRKTVVFRSTDLEGLGQPWVDWFKEHSLSVVCAVPLQTPRGCHGALAVGKRADFSLTDWDVAQLEQIAQPLAIAVENATAYERLSALRDRLADENVYLEREITRNHEFNEIVGNSRALAAVLHQIRTVAPTDATVLLLGETGTGKELVARAIHDSSRRRTGAFIRVNSAALPASLVESELFGYERGAFSGAAAAKAGRVELAHHGTLFLDEIGELPLEVQPKLLRALQDGHIERLGGTSTRHIDARLIAATNRDLEEMVARGEFRDDLYYRVSVFPIRVPPLRERPEDIPFLVRHFVDRFAREIGRTITTIPARTMRALQDARWPGNIRELQNVIERAVILSPGPTLEVPEPSVRVRSRQAARSATDTPARFSDGERDIILRALRDARGVIGGPQGAAARLGLRRTTLQSKMRKLGIERPSF